MIKYLIAIILILPVVIVTFPLLLIMKLRPNWFSIKFKYGYARFILKWLCIAFRVRFDINGLENIPKDQKYVLTPNHLSLFDAITMIMVSKRPITFVAKKETRNMPVVGMILEVIGGFFLDRKDVRRSLKMMKDIEDYINEHPEVGFVIFPEGTRSKDVNMMPGEFKGGSYKVAYKTEATVVPLTLYGTKKPLGFNEYLFHKIKVEIGTPIPYEEYKDLTTIELAKKCQTFVEEKMTQFNKKKTDTK